MVERGVKREQGEGGDLSLPPGFRFHPTDEEVITSYLLQKLLNPSFSPRAMGEVNLNKCEPWDLPSKAKMGEKEWYFFCHKDMKYPTGMRTNRATEKGYWKATGKDREIFKPAAAAASSSASGRDRELVGMKKTLVFYLGRAPRGSKTNWVMHEFRIEGKNRPSTSPKDEWVVCKVFHKNNPGGEDHKKARAAAADYSSVGTPNVSSISVDAGTADNDGGVVDGFIDSMVGPVSYFNDSTAAAGSFLPGFSTTSSASTMINAAADYYSGNPAAATMTTTGGFVGDDLPSYNAFSGDTTTSRHNLINQAQAAAVVPNATLSAVPTSSSYDVSSLFSSWNLLHADQLMNPMGISSSYNLHDQATMMARALGGGGGVSTNFAAGLHVPASSAGTGISQHNSPLGRGGGSYAPPNHYLATSASPATAGKNLGA